jgi:quinolinate synthase
LNYTKTSDKQEFIVGTESGILHQMIKNAPGKRFIPAPPVNNCACNDCPHMKKNTLQKLHDCLLNESPEIILDEHIRLKAGKSIQRMLELSVNL